MLHLSVSVIIKFSVYTTTALSTIENPMKKNLSNAAAAAGAAAASLMKQIVVTAAAHLRIAPPVMGPQRVSNPRDLVFGSAASFEERQVILGEQLETMPLEVGSVQD